MASSRDCLCEEAKSHRQSLQEAIYQAQQSQQEASDPGQSRQKPNMMGSLCRKRKLADLFIPCIVKGTDLKRTFQEKKSLKTSFKSSRTTTGQFQNFQSEKNVLKLLLNSESKLAS